MKFGLKRNRGLKEFAVTSALGLATSSAVIAATPEGASAVLDGGPVIVTIVTILTNAIITIFRIIYEDRKERKER